nr:hypothetical protein [Nitritalea halalkaliphila]
MNTTLIKTHQGRSLMLQHDVSSPRPYSRLHVISGTAATPKNILRRKSLRGIAG